MTSKNENMNISAATDRIFLKFYFVLCMENTPFLEKARQLTKVRAIWKTAIRNLSFKSKLKHTSIKDIFKNTRKGSKNYKKILQSTVKAKNNPADTICTNWNIAAKYEKTNYLKKVFTFWKTPYLPSYLQNLHLQIINHKLKLNSQLKHFARDENNQLISGDCTFCKLNTIANPSEESFTHLFLECASSMNSLTPVATKFNITVPDMNEEGEKILYFWQQDCNWTEMRTNIFFLIYKYYINNCRLRKILPTSQQFENTVRYETKKIVLANPTTTGLIDNLLPIWVGREMEEKETLEILEECEGDNNKGRIFMDANKRTVILNTKLHLGFGFPCKPGTSKLQRLNDVRNGDKIRVRMMNPVLKLTSKT